MTPQATAAGLSPSLLLAVAWRESGFDPAAVAGNGSTASGMFQFIEDAWLDAVRLYGPKHGLVGYARQLRLEDGGTTAVSDRARHRILGLRRDVRIAAAMAAETMVDERGELEDDLGRPTRPADLYFRHLLGPAGSRRFLPAVAATPHVSSEDFLGRIAHANPIIFYRHGNPLSLGDAYANVATMLNERMVMYGDQVRQYQVAASAAATASAAKRRMARLRDDRALTYRQATWFTSRPRRAMPAPIAERVTAMRDEAGPCLPVSGSVLHYHCR